MPILNMIAQGSGGGGGGSNVGEPTNLFATAISNSSIDITWTDNGLQAIPPSTFQKSVLVRKVGSAPTTPSDGTTVVTETVMNTYQSSAYSDTGLTQGTTYYYQVFSYSTDGGITYGTPASATPQAGWEPGVNTIAYWKLDGDALDYSGNSRNLTASGITYESGGPGQVGVFSGGATAYYQDNTLFNISYPFTYSLYVQAAVVPSGMYDSTNPYYTMAIVTQDGTNDNIFDKVFGFAEDGFLGFNYYDDGYYCMGGTAQSNTRYYLVYTFDGVKQRIYSNGTLVGENPCGGSYTGFSNARLVLASQRERSETIAFNGKMSNVIIENKVRTAQEVADYYDQTKGDYGIS